MEFADIEFATQFLLRFVLQAHNRKRADFIGQCLRWNGDIPLNFGRGIRFAHVAIGEHIFDGLFAGPSLAVDTSVNHKAHGAQHFVRQCTEALIGILKQPHLITQGFRIKRPAFDIGRVSAETHESRQLLIFLRDADLEMMPRRAFMQIQCGHARRGAAWKVIGVEVKCPRARTVRRTLLIAAARFIFFAEFFIGFNLKRCLWQIFELRRNCCVDLSADVVITLRQRIAARHFEFRIRTQMLEKFGQGAFEANFILDGFHTRFNPGDFRQTQIVDVVGLQWQGRRLFDQILIQALAALHGRQSDLFARQGQIAIAQEVTQTGIGGVQTVDDDVAIFGSQAGFVRIAEIRREF